MNALTNIFVNIKTSTVLKLVFKQKQGGKMPDVYELHHTQMNLLRLDYFPIVFSFLKKLRLNSLVKRHSSFNACSL